jgi:hypothetical protein
MMSDGLEIRWSFKIGTTGKFKKVSIPLIYVLLKMYYRRLLGKSILIH